ncbi:MAG TPA: ABC transporter substrate-binding protein [Acetobacteraceae bacterium]|nr:ABC transporter substrate-binding protein [Acetobacteraceae bacterium]
MFKEQETSVSRAKFAGPLLALGSALFCAGISMHAVHAQTVRLPKRIATTGKITYCSDISSPPLEYYSLNSRPIGSDIDLGNAIAQRMGVKAVWKNVPFNGIVPALLARQCDAIISQLFDKPARRRVIDLIDYMNSSEALLVKSGSSRKIRTLGDLSGLKVAVENGTTVADLLAAQNRKFQSSGKKPMDIVVFPKDTDALQQLQVGQVDAYGTTLETAAYYMKKSPHSFAVAGKPFGQILTAIGVRKGDPKLRTAIQTAFDSLKADGTDLKILKKWGIEADRLP